MSPQQLRWNQTVLLSYLTFIGHCGHRVCLPMVFSPSALKAMPVRLRCHFLQERLLESLERICLGVLSAGPLNFNWAWMALNKKTKISFSI